MILFGGQTSNNDTLGDLYILDMVSMMWNLSQTVPASQSRHSMACSVSGDNFIIWGGKFFHLQASRFHGRAVFTPIEPKSA